MSTTAAYHVYWPEHTHGEPLLNVPLVDQSDETVVRLAEEYLGAIYFEVLPEAHPIEIKVTACSACGSTAEHHVAYVRDHGLCVV